MNEELKNKIIELAAKKTCEVEDVIFAAIVAKYGKDHCHGPELIGGILKALDGLLEKADAKDTRALLSPIKSAVSWEIGEYYRKRMENEGNKVSPIRPSTQGAERGKDAKADGGNSKSN